jgi:hypothetical protein
MTLASVPDRSVELAGEGPADGDADHHPDPRLLGEQGAERDLALGRVVELERLAELGLVRFCKPAARLERLGEDALQLRGGLGDDRLGLAEAVGLLERLDRDLELPLGVGPGGVGRRGRRQEAARFGS